MSVPAVSEQGQHLPAPGVRLPRPLRLLLLLAIIALSGSLYLSVVMGLKACPLCLYQRAFVMGVVSVLLIGAATRKRFGGAPILMALPLATAGLAIAGFHVYLELVGRLECPKGVFGLGTAPQQSLTVFGLIVVLMLAGIARRDRDPESEGFPVVTSILLGLLFAWAAVASAPPLPAAPTKAYEQPLDMCRPPFQGG